MISQQTIESVRARISIVSVVGERVKLERRGRTHLGLCPFHKEKTPSFHVNAEKGFYYCFGCQAKGNAITFVQALDGLTFPEAVRALAERAGIEVEDDASQVELRQQAEQRRRRDELFEVGRAAAEFFEDCLQRHPLAGLAQEELGRRGLWPADDAIAATLKAFRVGYAPYGWEGLGAHLAARKFSRPAAEAVGLLVPRRTGDGHYDRFRHRLMFAVVDVQGRVVAFSGRSLREPSAEQLRALGLSPAPSGETAKYLNSPESVIYRKREILFGLFQAKDAVREQDQCVVVEGNFDVVSLHARGVKHVVAPLGTAFTEEQAEQLARFTRRVTFFFDSDAAGRRATAKVREPCHKAALAVRVAQPPTGKDPDELVRLQGAEGVQRVLTAARPLLEYLIESALAVSVGQHDARAQADKVREVSELIAAEPDPTARLLAERYADSVAARLGVGDAKGLSALRERVVRAAGPLSEPATVGHRTPSRERASKPLGPVESQVLGALVEYPDLQHDPTVKPLLGVLEGELALALVSLRAVEGASSSEPRQSADVGPRLELDDVSRRFPDSSRALVAQRLVAPQIATRDAALVVLLDNLSKLQRLQAKRQLRDVVEQVRKAEAGGDLEALKQLLADQQARARARRGLA